VGTLEEAQIRKLDFHADQVNAAYAKRILDIGCGWGSLLRRLTTFHHVEHAVGLTLSESQLKFIQASNSPQIEVRLEHWRDHTPQAPYDGIVSIGALEHFVNPSQPSSERVEVYRDFFQSCRSWLKPGGRLSLQASAYARGSFVKGAISAIFPESDLPRLVELADASEGLFEVVCLRNDRDDYARTCRAWLARLEAVRDEAIAVIGEPEVRHFEAFLAAAARGFDARVFALYRMTLIRLD
jgi:cyclopropane-fatty-acyl-phospholipid synthase